MPFSEHQGVNHPLQFYAATKRANELMAHAYSHMFSVPATGLCFFTVYGPWGPLKIGPLANRQGLAVNINYLLICKYNRVCETNPIWLGNSFYPCATASLQGSCHRRSQP